MNFDFTKQPGRIKLNKCIVNSYIEPLVSIITPFYNSGKYFEQTYNCIMNQTFPWFEWIIVNDGSTRKEDISTLTKLAESDNRIKVLHKQNGGISTARNKAIAESSTDIIIPLDADDLIVPTFVETIFWALYYNPQYSWCYTKSVGFQDEEYVWDKPFDAKRLKKYNFLVNCAGIRKKDLLEVGCYDETLKHYNEDWRLWLKFLSAGKKPIKLGYYGFWYRRTDKGVLSLVKQNKHAKKVARTLINEVAKTADTNVTAKEYPCRGKINQFIGPRFSNFERKLYNVNDKLNILMLIPWMEMGGADIFNLEVVKGLNKERYNISIFTTVPCNNQWRQRFEDYVTDIFELPSFLDIENYAEFISYYIKSRDIKLVFLSNSYYGYYLVPWIKKNFPEIVILDYVHMEEWYWRSGGFARTSGVVGGLLEKTYVCNERTRQVLINHFNRAQESVKTLYIGVDKEKYNADIVEYGQAKETLNISPKRPCILFPCRIHPQKRPFLMIEIADRLRQKINDIAFIVVGDGPQMVELQRACHKRGLENTVYFAGQQSDMRPYYKDCEITLICSLKEGLALTAYESCSMSTPVVSSDVGGQAELIDSSVGAILPLLQSEKEQLDNRIFEEQEIEQYIKAIEDIITDKQKYNLLCYNCRQKIENSFSTKVMIKNLEDEIEQLVQDCSSKGIRQRTSQMLVEMGQFADDYVTAFVEIEKSTSGSFIRDEVIHRLFKYKLLRVVVRIGLKLKLDKLL